MPSTRPRTYYEDLLEAGVKLYEHRERVLHAKTAVIDGVWSTIGSTNFDSWSFMRNDELNVVIIGVDFADQMEALFKRDIAASKEVTREDWSSRPIWTRVRDWISPPHGPLALTLLKDTGFPPLFNPLNTCDFR